ncbi:sensor histidine kinase [Romboutsia sp. 1001713B170207_170306_H8]|uniref:sensor histidine kinase n=1 Tax=Romboutsia sp. 1001713B170207_170306_H8 TaxID=2787112 RepID=UPI0008222C25|nr:ATP-binding protein [Romboutsia sp. 1001713B170207_170306_H8]SCH46382.1 Sensor protein kinase walK [uncultured Clostridium sp.]
MKNKDRNNYVIKVYKYIFGQVIYLAVSAAIAIFTLFILRTTISDFQHLPIIRQLVHLFLYMKNNYIGDFITYSTIVFILTSCIYLILTHNKVKNIALLMESVEIMASGDLDKRIDVNSDDDIGELSRNINHIIEQLENKTVEERKAQQTKTDLITNVSHDLRTPLTSIIGYLNLIEEDRYKDEVQLRYYTNIAYEKSKDLNILINDLFELTKLQNNTLPLNKIDINLVELVSQVISYLGYQLSEVNMEIRPQFSNDKLIVNADPDKLVRVLENLINNAIKYGSDGKYIDIITKKESNKAVVEIINYGELIPQSDIPFIFDRFYRVEKSRNRNDGGSGLGLAISKNLIEAHNGNILVESNSSKTSFKIILPIE